MSGGLSKDAEILRARAMIQRIDLYLYLFRLMMMIAGGVVIGHYVEPVHVQLAGYILWGGLSARIWENK